MSRILSYVPNINAAFMHKGKGFEPVTFQLAVMPY